VMDVLNWVGEHWLLSIVLAIILTNGASRALAFLAVIIRGR
jgi:hypothetical protein